MSRFLKKGLILGLMGLSLLANAAEEKQTYGEVYFEESISQEQVPSIVFSSGLMVGNDLLDSYSVGVGYRHKVHPYWSFGFEGLLRMSSLSDHGKRLERGLQDQNIAQKTNEPNGSIYISSQFHPVYGKLNFLNGRYLDLTWDVQILAGMTRYADGTISGETNVPSFAIGTGPTLELSKKFAARLFVKRTSDNTFKDSRFNYTEVSLEWIWHL